MHIYSKISPYPPSHIQVHRAASKAQAQAPIEADSAPLPHTSAPRPHSRLSNGHHQRKPQPGIQRNTYITTLPIDSVTL